MLLPVVGISPEQFVQVGELEGVGGRKPGDRVALWRREWPRIAAEERDSDGRQPRYTFFFPEEEYRPEFLDPLAEMTQAGIGDVEVHLHHDRETEQNFIDRLSRFKETLRRRHGLDEATAAHLAGTYGTLAADVLACGPLDPIVDDGPELAAQVRYAREHEWALTVEDVLRRRTTLALRGLDTPSVRARVEELLA